MRLFNILLASLFVFSCSSLQGPNTANELTSETLKEKNISQKTIPQTYPFEEFFKTTSISSFQFAPNNTGVYFLKKDNNVNNVFFYDFKTSKIKQITKYTEMVSAYLVDPQGKYLYIQKDIGGSEIYDIYKFDLKNKKTSQLTDGKNIEKSYICDLDNDGNNLYFTQSRESRTYYDIKKIDINTNQISLVQSGGNNRYYCNGIDENDHYLAVMDFVDNNEIHQGFFNLTTKELKFVLNEKGVDTSGGIFDSQDNLYFLSTRDSDKRRLWKYDIKASKLALQTLDVDNNLTDIGIYGKSKVSALIFRGELEPEVVIYDGIFDTRRRFENLIGKITSVTFSKNDPELGVLSVQDGAAPLKYYIYNHGTLKIIFDANQSSIPSDSFTQYHSLFIKSFDGVKIPTHIFIPNGTSNTHKMPVLFWIHGGPEDNVDPNYSDRMQFVANQGFIIVAPNVRGSTGFGKSYQFMDNADWGGGHIKDILAVKNYIKNLDFVDSQNIFLMGGSFGGFSVMSLITQYPNEFKAAIDIFGPINFAPFIESWPVTTQAYWLSELGTDPRTDSAFNMRVSPFFHVKNIAIPLQIHQGANDIRVPKAQSDLLVDELKKMGKKYEYIVYSDEGHGFTKFVNQKTCYGSIVRFLKEQINKK